MDEIFFALGIPIVLKSLIFQYLLGYEDSGLTLSDHRRPVFSIVALNETSLVSHSQDCTVKIWDLESMTCLTTIRSLPETTPLLVTTDGQVVYCQCDNHIGIWSH